MSEAIEIRVTLDSPVPAYRQIVDGIRAHCVAGRLAPGKKLPPVRQLAGSLGVHFNTVAEAYRALAEEGWLILEGRRGATVLDRKTPHAPKAIELAEDSSRLHHLIAELQSKGVPRDWLRTQLLQILMSLESNS
jgi:DNA-binding transcriptional regulator YhcF (GntR family)